MDNILLIIRTMMDVNTIFGRIFFIILLIGSLLVISILIYRAKKYMGLMKKLEAKISNGIAKEKEIDAELENIRIELDKNLKTKEVISAMMDDEINRSEKEGN